MVANVIAVLVLVALVLAFAWLARRAWAIHNPVLKWLGVIVAGLLTVLGAAVTVVAVIGYIKFYTPQSNPVPSIHVAASADQVGRGQNLAYICAGCHSTAGVPPLDGGTRNFAGPLGDLYPPNLTPAGPLKDWSDGEIVRAIREGVGKNGQPLLVMPADQFHSMSDTDVQSVAAYLRSQASMPHDVPPANFNVLGAVIIGLGIFPNSVQPPITQPIISPPSGTPDYGKYLVSISACRVCHGENLAGGKPGGFTPVGPNLTVLVPKWTEADFFKEIRTGVDPQGHTLSDVMPWKAFSAAYSDAELGDLFKYLHGLTPTIQ